MPKKPNAEIREALMLLGGDLFTKADALRDQAAELDEIASFLMDEANELHNAKPGKPRAEPVPSGITRAVVIAVKARAFAGEAASDIAARYGFNQGRVTDIINGKYD